MTNIHVAVATTALFSISLSLGCSTHQESAPSKSPIPVKVKPVTTTGDVALARYSGSLEPAARVDMAFRVGGYVEMLGQVPGESGKPRALEEGDFVKQGTVLARIRSADYSQKVATARAGIGQARSEATLAEADLERAQKLFESKTISKAELDSKVARAEYARANVAAASARAGEAGVALEDTVLKAPMDGVVLARDLEVGTLVSPGRTVLTVADISTVKAQFAVPQALVEKLSLGSPLTVHVGAERESKAPQTTVDAKVTRIAPAADAKGRVFSVEAELPNPNASLRPGSVISVRIPEVALTSASLSVPLSAVVRSPKDPRGFSVFVIDGEAQRGKARLQQVQLGEVLGNAVTVEGGLRVGQRVVTVGATLIHDGSDAAIIP
ncbi:MAG TPA: efflux RND transporter periplasmic adaptor subunit [Polyangiaceae bacterium]|nr:efflux RND transporter periplasmic adaptor subunit [Polyangiaceae bacterium]